MRAGLLSAIDALPSISDGLPVAPRGGDWACKRRGSRHRTGLENVWPVHCPMSRLLQHTACWLLNRCPPAAHLLPTCQPALPPTPMHSDALFLSLASPDQGPTKASTPVVAVTREACLWCGQQQRGSTPLTLWYSTSTWSVLPPKTYGVHSHSRTTFSLQTRADFRIPTVMSSPDTRRNV